MLIYQLYEKNISSHNNFMCVNNVTENTNVSAVKMLTWACEKSLKPLGEYRVPRVGSKSANPCRSSLHWWYIFALWSRFFQKTTHFLTNLFHICSPEIRNLDRPPFVAVKIVMIFRCEYHGVTFIVRKKLEPLIII